MQRHLSKIPVTIVVCLLLSSSAFAQSKSQRAIRKAHIPNEPLKILEVRVAEQAINLDDSFAGDDDWLKGIRFKVKNLSTSPIVYLEIKLYIPESVTGDYPFLIPITFGQMPSASDDLNALTTVANKLLRDNDVEVAFSEEHYKSIKQVLARAGVTKAISDVELRIGMVVFDDGTAWNEGHPMRRDPNNPDRWEVVFPGPKPGSEIITKPFIHINKYSRRNGLPSSPFLRE
jgi:hypothetical protein